MHGATAAVVALPTVSVDSPLHRGSLKAGEPASWGLLRERGRVIKPPFSRVYAAAGLAVASIVWFVIGLAMTGRPYADPCSGFAFSVCGYTG